MKGRVILAVAVLALHTPQLAAQWTSARPDGHAPIGVMGDHRHHAGELMLSYRFMYMDMEGSRDGTTGVADAEIIDPDGAYQYMVTPTRMPMMMHMLGVMFAPVDRVTIMAMLPLISSEMDHLARNGNTFRTESSGVGDLKLTGLLGLAEFGRQSLHATVGVGIPTGSITQTGVTPMSSPNETQLPYPMQTGSGSWSLPIQLVYLGQIDDWSWGAQAGANFCLNDNNRDYRLGNQYSGTTWGARRLGDYFSVSLRGLFLRTENIEGSDPSAAPMMVPTWDSQLRAGTRFDAAVGINFVIPKAKSLRFAVEGLMPVYQSLEGPQLETNWQILAGAQITPIQG